MAAEEMGIGSMKNRLGEDGSIKDQGVYQPKIPFPVIEDPATEHFFKEMREVKDPEARQRQFATESKKMQQLLISLIHSQASLMKSRAEM